MAIGSYDVLLFSIRSYLPVVTLTKTWEADWYLVLYGCRLNFVRILKDILWVHGVGMCWTMVG